MRLHTIQLESKWLEFQKTGILIADENIICEEFFVDSYSWIEDKMHQLLPIQESKIRHPIWAWYKYCGKNKPDLRKRGYLEKDEIGYRIEFEIEDTKVLLTDVSDWHLGLCGGDFENSRSFLNIGKEDTEEDLKAFAKEGWEILNDKLIYNWDKIILDADSKKENIQATMWYLKIEQVKNITKFKSR